MSKRVEDAIRLVPDFPKKGIMFCDVTTAIKDAGVSEKDFYEIEGVKIPLFKLNPFEISSPAKVLAALTFICDDSKNVG